MKLVVHQNKKHWEKERENSSKYGKSIYTILICICHTQMDWMANDALYHRFLQWKLKCKNILECELAALSECQKCKKIITWSSDFEMDQYVSWGLSKDDMNLDTIWKRFGDFCKLQLNEVHAQFDLLISFHQGNNSVSEWYNAVQVQVNLARYPPETEKFTSQHILVLPMWQRFCVEVPLQEEVLTWTSFPQVESVS